jgi:glutathione S-transferase
MLGKQYGYYPEDPIKAWKVDSNIDANWDLQRIIVETRYAPLDKKEEAVNSFFRETLPQFSSIQNRLEANPSHKFIVGNELTIADFENAHSAFDYFYNDNNYWHREH